MAFYGHFAYALGSAVSAGPFNRQRGILLLTLRPSLGRSRICRLTRLFTPLRSLAIILICQLFLAPADECLQFGVDSRHLLDGRRRQLRWQLGALTRFTLLFIFGLLALAGRL